MAVNRFTFKGGYQFRHYGTQYQKVPGLFFSNIMWSHKDKIRLRDKQILELHEWLSRYINTYIHKTPDELTASSRAHARAIIRNVNKIEASQDDHK